MSNLTDEEMARCTCIENCTHCHEECLEFQFCKNYEMGQQYALEQVSQTLRNYSGAQFAAGTNDGLAEKLRSLGKELAKQAEELQVKINQKYGGTTRDKKDGRKPVHGEEGRASSTR